MLNLIGKSSLGKKLFIKKEDWIMKNLKKIMCILLVCLLGVFVLAACGGEGNKEPHMHTPGEEWLFDAENHWKECTEDGEKAEVAAHELDNEICSVCKVKVTTEGDKAEVYVLNDKGSWSVCHHYEGGKKVSEDTMEYKYFADGNVQFMTMKTNGKVSLEAEYGVDETGYNYEKKSTQYSEDGTKYTVEYDSKGDMLKETKVKADGTVEFDYTITHEYGDDGKKVSEKVYSGEKLVKEVKYIVVFADSWGGGSYNMEVTTYNEDGTTKVELFNESGELIQG